MAKLSEQTAKVEGTSDTIPPAVETPKQARETPRKIPGNLPYVMASGTLKKALERIIEASRPDRYNSDFLENVLKLTGSAARATIPILKKMGFLSSDGAPTDLYARFRTESGRGQATIHGLRSAFSDIFKKSEYAHTVDDTKLKDIIVEITGLKASDTIVQGIRSTFAAVRSFIPANSDTSFQDDEPLGTTENSSTPLSLTGSGNRTSTYNGNGGIRLAYNINIVLPETSDLKVLNAIFRSIKENLMQ